jgi:hypothetical protein
MVPLLARYQGNIDLVNDQLKMLNPALPPRA